METSLLPPNDVAFILKLTLFLILSILYYEKNHKFSSVFRKSISVDAKKPRPNLHSVAKHIGVSPSTVSPILNNPASVCASVRSHVLSSLKALGYESSPSRLTALSLENALALLISDISLCVLILCRTRINFQIVNWRQRF